MKARMDATIIVAILGIVSTFITATAAIVVALIQSGRIDRRVNENLERGEVPVEEAGILPDEDPVE